MIFFKFVFQIWFVDFDLDVFLKIFLELEDVQND